MIVTIDGPAGSGKSTVARILAERLAVRFLDTGAMYRAVGLAVLRAGTAESNCEQVSRLLSDLHIEIDDSRLLLNSEDVTDSIRTPEITAISSIIASQPAVRSRLVELQQEIGRQGSLVSEGRDQGTVVFPHADFKFFVTATIDARAWRRQQELSAVGSSIPFHVVRDQLRQRDDRDETREHAPMRAAENAIILDTSHMTIAEVVETMLSRIRSSP